MEDSVQIPCQLSQLASSTPAASPSKSNGPNAIWCSLAILLTAGAGVDRLCPVKSTELRLRFWLQRQHFLTRFDKITFACVPTGLTTLGHREEERDGSYVYGNKSGAEGSAFGSEAADGQ